MANLKLAVVGGFATGKRSFIESHLLHKPLDPVYGFYIYPAVSHETFTLKYADTNYCYVRINDKYIQKQDQDSLQEKLQDVIHKQEFIDKNERPLSDDEFKELVENSSRYIHEMPVLDELTVYMDDPFLKVFEITVTAHYDDYYVLNKETAIQSTMPSCFQISSI